MPRASRRSPPRVLTALVAVAISVSTLVAVERFVPLPSPLAALNCALRPFSSVNTYGLFATRTTTRNKIRIEGSTDGTTWRTYVFPDKPGPLERAPAYVQPHRPRLDWQMWFAALGRCKDNPWVLAFLQALLEARAPVLSLLAVNPLPAGPPRDMRSTVSPYRFTSLEEKRVTKQSWAAGPAQPYCPTVGLQSGHRAAVP